jgi:hypothetical protein
MTPATVDGGPTPRIRRRAGVVPGLPPALRPFRTKRNEGLSGPDLRAPR